MIPFIVSALSLSLFAAVTNAQPSTIAARSTRAITLVGDDIYLYGGSGSDGSCYSDLFTLHLDPSSGWVAGKAPWTSIKQSNPPVLGVNSWAVASTDGSSLMFYGQTLCPSLQDNNTTPPTYSSTSASVQYQNQHGSWSQATTETGVLGPRLVPNDEPVPVQVVDTQDHIAYTFVYDAFNAQLGMQLWSFPTSTLPSNIAQSGKNKTMVTSQPTTPASNSTTQPAEVVLAPYMDPGNAVYLDGKIIVVAGGRQGLALTGDNVDPASGLYKTDRCFVYTISTGLWTVQPLTAAGGSFPLSRSMAALVAGKS
ncbi:hypothetical protein BGZ49_001562 [Haplosporangium sp. Z 27]|nr:hypothetical protein BGZ49_001562 [Haplosporangium sp. Z 27]